MGASNGEQATLGCNGMQRVRGVTVANDSALMVKCYVTLEGLLVLVLECEVSLPDSHGPCKCNFLLIVVILIVVIGLSHVSLLFLSSLSSLTCCFFLCLLVDIRLSPSHQTTIVVSLFLCSSTHPSASIHSPLPSITTHMRSLL